ncbi:hypothetical protein G3578_20455 [Brevibacillus sp. SYP-B805]|uniref:hypothetical protein n=1 Tax=Brevibacillus sp. SYP-B805 TaxID=1578199 RepID=UPI0013EB0567|nr:hypothetical protein [Brevibacillus sp. SYP-B805]NGQ97510.1 hypothetical protein [Brevibacillus sp. SYP-B805]
MEKGIWKWIITSIPDSKLVELVLTLNQRRTQRNKIAIKGFSDLTRIKKDQFKLIRNRIEKEVLKPQNLLEIQSLLKQQEDLSDNASFPIETLGVDELYEIVTTETASYSIVDLMVFLLTSTNEEVRQKAEQLYEKLQENESLEKLASNSESNKASKQEEEAEKSVNTVQQPDETLEQLHHQIIQITNENKQLANEIKSQKKIIVGLESELKEAKKELEKRENELELRKNELSTRDKKIKELMEKIAVLEQNKEEQKNQIAYLNSELSQYKIEIEKYKNEISTLNSEMSLRKIPVVLIDNGKVLESLQSQRYNITLLTTNDLDNTVVLEQAEQIWYATFRVTPQKKAKLKELYGEKIVEFENYNKLREYCNAGMVLK